MRYQLILAGLLSVFIIAAKAGVPTTWHVRSPDGKLDLKLENGAQITWSLTDVNTALIAPSEISLTLGSGEVLGRNALIRRNQIQSVNTSFTTTFYKRSVVLNQYNELTLEFKGGYGLILRAYNDGVAYRFFIKRKGGLEIEDERADFNFTGDYDAYVPYVRDIRNKDIYMSSFEALYQHGKLSAVNKDTLAFTPLLINVNNSHKLAIMEADLEDYPGMFLKGNAAGSYGFHGNFARFPIAEQTGGFNNMNYVVAERAPYIAKTIGTRNLPWRCLVVSRDDKELANSDMVQKLASPCRLSDVSWIKPGKVAWDWWNDWNISKVDFKSGINNETYNYYTDFASANKLEYIILDEGWSERADMMKVVASIDLKQIITHARQQNVGIILWASWYAISQNVDKAFAYYSSIGIKGFKIDFLDRDDQKMVASCYQIAKKAAQYHLLVDFHGVYKPTGLQRTFPNVINFEAVKGMENEKWTAGDDVPGYDVTLPFIRMLAGPLDYTPGAMRNANQANFRPVNSNPMSQGTRCHQLAMYVIFEAPLAMLADNPTSYRKEQECTSFIAQIPTTFDETVVLDGKVGEHIAIARKSGDKWYLGAMNNWNRCDINLNMSFLGNGSFEAEIIRDGINADKDATDYKKEIIEITSATQLQAKLAGGGGWAAIIRRVAGHQPETVDKTH